MAVKLQLGNSNPEALAYCLAKLELRFLGSQAGAWEPADQYCVGLRLAPNRRTQVFYIECVRWFSVAKQPYDLRTFRWVFCIFTR